MNTCNHPGLRTTALAALVSFACAAHAVRPPTSTQSWYYDIGGASPISAAPNPGASTITLGATGTLGLKYSCGRFNITASVSNLFSNVATSLQNTLYSAATGAIAALPLYIFQRARPDLYELFQTYTADFTKAFNFALKSCEDYERDILAGKDPYAEWVALAKGENWKAQQSATSDAIVAKSNVESSGGDLGLTTYGGVRKAGVSQPPIEVVRDSTRAGYNMELNRAPTTTTPPSAGVGAPRLVELFPTPAAAEDFAVKVLGDEIIRTCDGCTSQSTAGHGLAPRIEAEKGTVSTNLANLISGASPPNYTNLQGIAAPGVAISRRVIETLQSLPDEERSILAGRLAAEVAVARTVEKALALRRMLLTAKREPHARGNDAIQERLDKGIAELEHEIDNVLYETRVRREISAATASLLLSRHNQLRSEAQAAPSTRREDPVQLREGGRFQ